MSLKLAPDFEQDTVSGSLRFHEWLDGAWCILLTERRQFSQRGRADLLAIAQARQSWRGRGIKFVGLSAETVEAALAWIIALERLHGCQIDFPIVADCDESVGCLYDPLFPAHSGTRQAFIIDPARYIRQVVPYPAASACDVAALLETVEAFRGGEAGGPCP